MLSISFLCLAPSLSLSVAGAPVALVVEARQTDEAQESYQFLAGLAEKGLHDMVVREAGTFLKRFPNHARSIYVRYRLGAALQQLGREQEALGPLRLVCEGDKSFEFRAEALYRLGRAQLTAGEAAAAAATFDKARRAGQDYLVGPASYFLGEALFAEKEFVAAWKAYGDALAIQDENASPHHQGARWGRVWCAFEVKEWKEVQNEATAFLERWPEGDLAHDVRFLRAESALESGDPTAALTIYREVGPGVHADNALRGMGFCYAALNDSAKAAEAFALLLQRFPQSDLAPEALLQLGVHRLRNGDPVGAATALGDKRLPQTAEAGYWRARAEFEVGSYEDCLTLLAALARRNDRTEELDARISTLRGDALARLGRSGEAAAAYGGASDPYTLQARAVAELNAGEWSQAEATAKEFLAGNGSSPYAEAVRLVLGEALFGQERHKDAAAEFAKLRESADESLRRRAQSRLGWCAWSLEAFEVALEAFDAATMTTADGIAQDSLGLEALAMAARAARKLQRDDVAAQRYASYIELAPKGPDADEMLWGLHETGGAADSQASLRELVKQFPDSQRAPSALLVLAEQNPADAGQLYELIRKRYSDSPEALSATYGLAWIASEAQDHERALAFLDQLASAQVAPDLRAAAEELAVWSAANVGNPARAIEALRALRKLGVDADQISSSALSAGTVLADAGLGQQADQLFAEVAASLGDSQLAAPLLAERAWFALDAGEPQQATQLAESLDRGDARRQELMFHIGETWYAAGDFATALRCYEEGAAEASPVADAALYKRGFAQLELQDPAAAARDFTQLVVSYPKSELAPEALYLAGEAYARAGDSKAALVALDRFIEKHTGHSSRSKALWRITVLRSERKEYAEARAAAETLLRSFPDFEARNHAELLLGEALLNSGDRSSSRRLFDRVVKAERGELAARARIGLGRIAAAESDHEAALAEFLKVAVLFEGPVVAEALYLAGESLVATGEQEAARARFEELVRDHKDTDWAKLAQRRLDGGETL